MATKVAMQGKYEDHEGEGCGGGSGPGQGVLQHGVAGYGLIGGSLGEALLLAAVEYAHGTYDEFFRGYSGDDADAHLPVEAEGLEDGLDGLADHADVGVLLLPGTR